MPVPRERLISLEATPFYHLISRCVRRQFLCGFDADRNLDFSHRREWIRERLFELSEVFAIDVCAYAILANHYHLVVRVDQESALVWSDLEVAQRWTQMFSGPPLVRSFVAGKSLSKGQRTVVDGYIRRYRKRLHSISWFMRCLNEPIARQANQDDNVTGRFWEGRFKSQALLDEAAVLSAMCYVDLNPIRAGIATTPEASDFTSIQQRIAEWAARTRQNIDSDTKSRIPAPESEDVRTSIRTLLGFADEPGADPEKSIPIGSNDYLELVDWTGRAVIEGKRGAIPDSLPPLLTRLSIQPEQYLRFIRRQESGFHHVIGAVDKIRELAGLFGKSFFKGQAAAARLFSPGG